MDLQIRNLNIQNASLPTGIQDYLQYKYWISLPFVWLSCLVKIDFKIFPFQESKLAAASYVPMAAKYRKNQVSNLWLHLLMVVKTKFIVAKRD